MRGFGPFAARGTAWKDLRTRRGSPRINAIAAFTDVRRIEQSRKRDLREIWIAQVLAAIRKVPPHHFGYVMNRSRRACARFLIARTLEHPQHLQNPDAARAG